MPCPPQATGMKAEFESFSLIGKHFGSKHIRIATTPLSPKPKVSDDQKRLSLSQVDSLNNF